jgi:hypothetical protein
VLKLIRREKMDEKPRADNFGLWVVVTSVLILMGFVIWLGAGIVVALAAILILTGGLYVTSL